MTLEMVLSVAAGVALLAAWATGEKYPRAQQTFMGLFVVLLLVVVLAASSLVKLPETMH
jgi:hypothetical protein